MAFLSGHKTYIVAGVTVVYALTEWLVAGAIDQSTAIGLILGALGLSGLRSGIASK